MAFARDEDFSKPAQDIIKSFAIIVVKSPVAIVTLALSTFFGYGISFVVFDYRKGKVGRSHYFFHVAMGLGYAALVFCALNVDILSRELTADQIASRMPLTLLVSFACAFIVLVAGAVWRERAPAKPRRKP